MWPSGRMLAWHVQSPGFIPQSVCVCVCVCVFRSKIRILAISLCKLPLVLRILEEVSRISSEDWIIIIIITIIIILAVLGCRV
jgi:hypothetical protein